MIRKYCDCCGVETNVLYTLSLYNHIVNPIGGYVAFQEDGTFEKINMRMESLEMCLKCYNSTASEAYNKFNNIKGNNGK